MAIGMPNARKPNRLTPKRRQVPCSLPYSVLGAVLNSPAGVRISRTMSRQVDDDRGKGHDGQRPVDEGHIHVGSDGIGVQRLEHHGNTAEKQQHQSRKHEQGGDDVHGLARRAADHVDEHVHRDVLVPVKASMPPMNVM